MGRLQPHKNVDLLISALAQLRNQGRMLSLTIIGDGPERDSLERLAKKLEVQDQVAFLGALTSDEDVYSHLRSAKLFVHPSTKEGGGSITSLEANAAGIPVIAFRHPLGISPELIEEGVNGHWISDISVAGLAAGIAQLWDAESGETLSERCATFAKQFDWEGLAEQYADYLVADKV